ncbi:HAD family phosphatase [Cellulomonas sp. PhB143]|uniref:HAD family hydrolase n=1 Tax=Cellulomonas sp. PhB143 TaxID=2485186 RepID=UPI000F46A22D|nr:HAD family phosphatase [Cellulomonas sp. PhB143]ROS74371.1 HAD superfamily hydrolase (TIGR01509 family) [Cellulomonas sp. PhB143]
MAEVEEGSALRTEAGAGTAGASGVRGTAGATGPRTPAAVLWDMDGTLVDSEPYWMEAEAELVARHGGTWTHEDALGLVGNPLEVSAAVLLEAGVRLEVPQILTFLVTTVARRISEHVPWRPGALELLVAVREAGIPCALVTMSYRELAVPLVAAAPAGAFDQLVCGDDVRRGKPDPEPYLRAAQLLGVDARDCVAVEDSPPGIASALAAGATTLGVEAVVPVRPAPGLNRVATLAGVDVELLRRMHGGELVDRMP